MDIQAERQTVEEFLHSQGMSPAQIDFDSALDMFLEEMRRGLSGEKSSLQMIPTYLDVDGDIPADEPVLVLDAGGTNFRVATVTFDREKQARVENFQKFPMPGAGAKYPVDRNSFFDTIVDYMETNLSAWRVDRPLRLSFCFSYPTEITRQRDGRLLHFSKEINAPEVVGEMIGARLVEALERTGNRRPETLVLLNDTVATLLAGRSSTPSERFDGFVGFILGTGTNTAYVESNSTITKLYSSRDGSIDPAGQQVINMETGGMNRIPGGRVDDLFDSETKSPGHYRFEKMISGAYLGPLGARLLRVAAEEGLLSSAMVRGVGPETSFDTIALGRFLENPFEPDHLLNGSFRRETDRLRSYLLLQAVVERAAKLSAVNLSATVLQEGGGQNPTRPTAICADGTTLYKTKDLLFLTRSYLQEYLVRRRRRYIEILYRDRAPLIGTAVAGLLN